MTMKDQSCKQNISHGNLATIGFVSDVHRSIPLANDLPRLRSALNAALGMPRGERDGWLLRNVTDSEEREAIATLLSLCDDDLFLDVDGG